MGAATTKENEVNAIREIVECIELFDSDIDFNEGRSI